MVLYNGKSSNNELFRILMHVFPSLLTSRVLSSSALLGKVVKPSLWHHKFGHPSNEILEALLKDFSVSSSSDVITHACSHCITGKMRRLAFSEKLDRVDIPFYEVHTDVCGLSLVVAIDGFRYYVSYVDEATRFVWIYPLINKSEVFGVFVRFCAYVENQFSTKIKVINLILPFILYPYTPQHNGLVEKEA